MPTGLYWATIVMLWCVVLCLGFFLGKGGGGAMVFFLFFSLSILRRSAVSGQRRRDWHAATSHTAGLGSGLRRRRRGSPGGGGEGIGWHPRE